MNIGDLIVHGRAEVDFDTRGTIPNIIEGFQDLIRLPESERKLWEFSFTDDGSDTPDSGLIEKRVEDGKDPKFYFHYRPIVTHQLAIRDVPFQKHFQLLQQCDDLYHRLKQTSEQIIQELDEEMPECEFLQRLYARPEHLRHTLRLLWYKPGYETMAKEHHDRSSLTLAVAESRPGLYFTKDHALYHPSPGRILAFNGIKSEIHTNGSLESMAHYVKNEELEQERWAIVFFTHCLVNVTEGHVTQLIQDHISGSSSY